MSNGSTSSNLTPEQQELLDKTYNFHTPSVVRLLHLIQFVRPIYYIKNGEKVKVNNPEFLFKRDFDGLYHGCIVIGTKHFLSISPRQDIRLAIDDAARAAFNKLSKV